MFDPSPSTVDFVQQCLARSKAGDAEALNDLFRRVQDRFLYWARLMFRGDSRLGRYAGAEDLVQDTLTQLFRELSNEKVNDARHFFALSAKILRQKLIALLRHFFGPEGSGANRAAVGLGPGDSSGLPCPGVDPTGTGRTPPQDAAWREFLEKIELLDDDHRELFDLLWTQGLTQDEVATLRGVSRATVERRWHHAKLALFDLYDGDFPLAL